MVDLDLAMTGTGAGAMLFGYLDDGRFRQPIAYQHGDPASFTLPASSMLLGELAWTVWTSLWVSSTSGLKAGITLESFVIRRSGTTFTV